MNEHYNRIIPNGQGAAPRPGGMFYPPQSPLRLAGEVISLALKNDRLCVVRSFFVASVDV